MAVQISGNDITVPRDGSFTRNVTIGGTLTYEDVTNIDSVGLVTARSGIEIGARPGVAASISVDGNMIVSGISTFNGDVKLDADGSASSNFLSIGADDDLKIFHQSNVDKIESSANGLHIRQINNGDLHIHAGADTSSSNNRLVARAAGAAELYHSGSLKLTTSSTGATITGELDTSGLTGSADITFKRSGNTRLTVDNGGITVGGDIKYNDNYKIKAGTGADLEIYHDGSDSRIVDTGTGELRIDSNLLRIRNAAGSETCAVFTENGSVELRYDNVKKFETTSTGADFTVASGEVDIYSTGSGTQHSLRLLNADASTGNEIGIYFGPANNVAGAFINGYSEADFSSNANRSASLRFGVRNAGTLFECAKFTHGGFFQASNSATYDAHSYATSAHQFHSQQRYFDTVWIANTNANYERSALRFDITRSATSSYHFITATSGALTDDEFRVRGDGQVYADGSFNGGGADYAEYFEWTDGNSSNEDRRGMTVVLDGSKVRLSTSSDSADNIIGVVSGRPTIIGDSASERWTGKYQKDDYNEYILDSDGYRQLSPSYDDTKTYVPREERQEWDAIGMVGKLRIRKGQQTGTRWIKMRDVSDAVEEWLVR